MDIITDSNPTDAIDYGVKFEGGKLIAVVGNKQYGAKNTLELDGMAVVSAVIDLIEQGIPGDQKAIAAEAKAAAALALAAQK